MSEILEKLSFYHSLSVLCLAAGLLLLSAAAVLFFRWKLRAAIRYLSGRQAREEIRRLERENGFRETTVLLDKKRNRQKRGGKEFEEENTVLLSFAGSASGASAGKAAGELGAAAGRGGNRSGSGERG